MSDDLVKRLRELASREAETMPPGWPDAHALYRAAADRIKADATRIAELERSRDDWRDDYRTLEKAIVGDTGLSAMTIAAQARTFRPRAEAAEARIAELEAALSRVEGMTPKSANAATARDLHLTVQAIARAALEGEK